MPRRIAVHERPSTVGPMTYDEATALVTAERRASHAERLLRGHALLTIQSYDLARAELERLQRENLEPALAARVAADLQYLAYYLGHFADGTVYFERGLRDAAGDPVLVADLYMGRSLCAIALNDVRHAIDSARFAADALRAAPNSRTAELLRCRVEIQLMHVLAQSADYVHAASAAREALDRAHEFDDWERCRATYAVGYAAWCWGHVEEAEGALRDAEAIVRHWTPPIWRWIQLCLARVTAEQGKVDDAKQFATQSGFNAPEEYAFVSLLTGGARRARELLNDYPVPRVDEVPFRDAVDGIVTLHEGRPRDAISKLETAEERFAAYGLHHYAFGCALHGAFAREQVMHGSGKRRAAAVLAELQQRTATGFAWYERRVAEWLAGIAVDDTRLREIGRALERRVRTSAGLPEDLASRCRHAGLTWREIEIVRVIRGRVEKGTSISRDSLASELGITPSTLRVHVSRIREKLDVSGRGDEAIAAAINAASDQPSSTS